MDLDIDRFIFEIENHPAIWNMKCDDYSNRVQKVKQWEEVINQFIDKNASVEEKIKHGKALQKRWRTLRDTFVKQRRELATTKSGSAASNKKYKYFNQLMFLLPVVAMNTTENSMASQENNDPVEGQHGSNIIPPEPKKTKKSDSTDKIGNELLNVLKSTMQRKTDEEDSDRQFMLSLVTDFKRVPERLKARVKINILKCILEAQGEVGDNYENDSYLNQYGGYYTKPHRLSTENRHPSNELSSSSFNIAPEEHTERNYSNNQQSHNMQTSTLTMVDQTSPISVNTRYSEESELLPLFEN